MTAKITSAQFMRGISGTDEMLDNALPQVAFIGRSNVGKSSVINSLTGQKALAKTSATPGRTREINIFLVNDSFYLLDLPGYGFSAGSWEERDKLQKLIHWYLFDSPYEQKIVVLIIDVNVGATNTDAEMLAGLEQHGKCVIIVANKVDKIKKSEYAEKIAAARIFAGQHEIVFYSSEKQMGADELARAILEKH